MSSATPISTSRDWVELVVVDEVIYVIGGGEPGGELGYESLGTAEKYKPVDYISDFPSIVTLLLLITATFAVTLIYKKDTY